MKILLLIITIVALSTTARADNPSAEALYTAGQAAYDHGDYQIAIDKWQESYRLSGESGLLFNIAQAMRLAGDCTGAITTYRKFMAADADPASEQHKLAEDFTRELEPTCRAPAPVADPKPPLGDRLNLVDPLNTPKDHGRALRIAGLGTGGAGIAAIATGLALGYHAQTLGQDVTDACRTSCDWAVQKDKEAAGRRDAMIGRVLDIAGATAIAGGVVMYYLGARQSGVTITPRSEGATLSWSGSW